MEANVIKIPCSGDGYEFVLVQVLIDNSKPLHLTLIGTEGESVYSASIKSVETLGLTWRGDPPSQYKLEQLISSIFVGITAEDKEAITDNYEAVSDIKNETMVITFREKIEGIIRVFGDITLQPDEREISLFHWCHFVLQSKQEFLSDFKALNLKVAERDRQIEKLKQSLSELTTMKIKHENDMLQKFLLLLNEKKMKIRDQQRLQSELEPPKEPLTDIGGTLTQYKPVVSTKSSIGKSDRSSKRHSNHGLIDKEEDEEENSDTLTQPKPSISTRKSTRKPAKKNVRQPTKRPRRKAGQIQSDEEKDDNEGEEKDRYHLALSNSAVCTRDLTRQSKRKAYQVQSEEDYEKHKEKEEGSTASEFETEEETSKDPEQVQEMMSIVSETESDKGNSPEVTSIPISANSDVVIPPKRQLPFVRKKVQPIKSPTVNSPVALNGSETESDNEL